MTTTDDRFSKERYEELLRREAELNEQQGSISRDTFGLLTELSAEPSKAVAIEVELRQLRVVEENVHRSMRLVEQNLADFREAVKYQEERERQEKLLQVARVQADAAKSQADAAKSQADAARKLNLLTVALIIVGAAQILAALAQVWMAGA
jgi:hypothetical protein